MQRLSSIVVPVCVLVVAIVSSVRSVAAQRIPGVERWESDASARIGEDHWKLTGSVKLVLSGGTTIFADEAEVFLNEDRAVAAGNVVFRQGTSQISADRADFNIKTRLGTFYNASGMATFQPPAQTSRSGSGIAPPPVSTQSADVYFFGETIEKIGATKFKITRGGFTTCVQPTPRWDLHADTVLLNIDHYTLLRQAVLKVKGVPMLYVPALYYPTKKDQRSTGFLLPTYGYSSLRGQQLHNAFFWAINRSQDATFEHEHHSRTGQGAAGEYRYNLGGGSDGDIKLHLLDEHQPQSGGNVQTVAATRTYDLRGGANQMLPGNLHARANVNYFSSITANQTYNMNVADASRSKRHFRGNVVGAWNGYSLNTTFERSEDFSAKDNSTVTGGTPTIEFSISQRQLLTSPVYFSVKSEYVHLLNETKQATTVTSQDLTRLDFRPQVSFPFKKWPWFNVDSSFGWRDTFYTRSLVAAAAAGAKPRIVDDPVNRRFLTAGTAIRGPIFVRTFDTPDRAYAEQFKHTIEPSLTLQHTSSVDNYARIVKTGGGVDVVAGTEVTYGIGNRLYAWRHSEPGAPSSSREIIRVDLTQTYNTNDKAAPLDTHYATSALSAAPNNFTPLKLTVRATPADAGDASLAAEFDSRYRSLRTITLSGQYSWGGGLDTDAKWSRKFLIPKLEGFDDATSLDDTVSSTTGVHTKDNRVGSKYFFSYDVQKSRMLQQRLSGFYNAQCCGIAFEYQSFNLLGLGTSAPIPVDRRFFLSVTLAGLGNFSPFNGALSGVPR